MTFSNPEAYVIGSSPKMDPISRERLIGIDPPLELASGKPCGRRPIRATPLWNKGRVLETALHWRNEAARRRCGGDMSKATGDEIVLVPVYAAVAASIATSYRAAHKKNTRLERLKAILRARLKQQQQKAAA